MLWLSALAVFAVIILQTVIYMRAASRAGPAVGFTRQDLRESFRAGGVAAIGPSLAVVIVAIALLPLFGAPAVLVRIGLVGSAATETSSANLAAGTMDAALGGPTKRKRSGKDCSLAASLTVMVRPWRGWMYQ